MRKKDKEITDPVILDSIIQRATVCHLGLCVDNFPYVVPLNFGYQNGKLFFHTGREGLKMDLLHRNNRVCFEMTVDVDVVQAETPCKWNMKYYSVIGFGAAHFVKEPVAKRQALDLIMTHYGGEPDDYPEELVAKVVIIQVDIDLLTGRQSG
jgi:nitroimidazol reductase NimA-like FMN-containing flavoprotein (pyridoxamine 5'-phosphate oxidase superfamily)